MLSNFTKTCIRILGCSQDGGGNSLRSLAVDYDGGAYEDDLLSVGKSVDNVLLACIKQGTDNPLPGADADPAQVLDGLEYAVKQITAARDEFKRVEWDRKPSGP